MALATCALTLGSSGCAKVGSESPGAGGSGGGAAFDGGAAGTGAAGLGDAGTTLPDAAYEAPVYATCGNSIVEPGETCDDGNTTSGDGCSSACRIEPNYTCPMVAKPCVHNVVCGDHLIEGNEACDDGNTTSGDGCSSTCTLECGWECPPGAACRAAKCGDGMVAGNEQCDDGNTTSGDGCSALCLLESKPAGVPEGWVCTSPTTAAGDGGAASCTGPTACTTTVCGNGKKEGSEQCDDGNKVTGDGCDPFCRLEPVCPPGGGACSTVCGSGLLLKGDTMKQCDDGNTVDGDGCSHDCKIEPGYTCQSVSVSPNPLILPVVYHDFESWKDDPPHGHPDFEHYQGNGVAGMVLPQLGTAGGGVPVHVAQCWAWSSNLCAPPANATPTWDSTVDWFGMWYVDTPMFNKTIVQTLTLGGQVSGVASTTCNMTGQPACTSFQFSNEQFFPLDAAAGTWGITPGQAHDFGFTSVARYWFQYEGAATLTFVGDDDVFVFINQKLAVDLGGTHQRAQGSITLNATDGTGFSCDFAAPGTALATLAACNSATQTGGGHVVSLGLAIGSVYEIDVFQAERFTVESHYQLTLSNFTGNKSVCKSACGDGVVTPPETCDLGTAMNTGAYGGCNADCTLAPYCGDGVVTAPEPCDYKAAGTKNCDKNCKVIVVQ